MPPQVPLEMRADVIELVKERDELVVEILVEKARQTERNQVEHFLAVDDEVLHLVGDAAAATHQVAAAKPKRRHAGL